MASTLEIDNDKKVTYMTR